MQPIPIQDSNGLLDWALRKKKKRIFSGFKKGKTLDSVIQPPKQNLQSSTAVVVNPLWMRLYPGYISKTLDPFLMSRALKLDGVATL